MSKVPDNTWKDILGHLQINHPQLMRGWFSTLRPLQVKGGVLEIEAINDAQRRYLEQHCRFALAEAAQAATGRLITVAISIPDEGEVSDPPTNPPDELVLNADYTFDNFVTGPSNRLAHAAAVAVAEDPGRTYNPLFVHGAVGLGKTHLLQATCRAILEKHPGCLCYYISCESFINHFMEAVESGALHQFRYRYRHVDVLVIDDIQFLAERERSQEEFFHTFNTLYQSQRQIILSADCCPAEIPSLEERLVSRFNAGLVALLDRPCTETRMAIVRKKAKLRCIEVPEEVVRVIASRIETNIRDLQGVLTKLDAMSQTSGTPITPAMAEEALGVSPANPIRIPAILEAVANRFDVRVADLQGKKRSKSITRPRHVSMYLARQLTSKSLEDIGGYFGGRDHTTVLHADRTIRKLAESDPVFRELLDEIASDVKNASY
jgi:chromosomal replication initiator protein